MPDSASKPPRTSLGTVFLTLYIDLVGFSIVFPLFPAILDHYLTAEGETGLLNWILGQLEAVARFAGADEPYTAVLFGGFLGSIYSFLQFLCAPWWGRLSDRIGRRPVLLFTISGTAFSYLLWCLSGSFLLFILARLIGGAMSGNLSVASAAVADVTSRADRVKGMGLVGVAFGLGFITGPAIGGIAASFDPTAWFPGLTAIGVNPFSMPAFCAFAVCLINLGWVATRFRETLPEESRGQEREIRPKGLWKALVRGFSHPSGRTTLLYFLFILGFSGMEFTLTFLAVDRFAYTPRQIIGIFVFLGIVLILTQGVLVRRLAPKVGEKPLLFAGLALVTAGLAGLGLAAGPIAFYIALGLTAVGSGLTNPAVSALISLYSPASEQGRALGIFRSLGSLARAIGPLLASVSFWWLGSQTSYLIGAGLIAAPLAITLTLPRPGKKGIEPVPAPGKV